MCEHTVAIKYNFNLFAFLFLLLHIPITYTLSSAVTKQALALPVLHFNPKEAINLKLQSCLYDHSANTDGGFIQCGMAKRKLQGVIEGDIGLAKAELLPWASLGASR